MTAAPGRRAHCGRCLRPAATCLCGWIRPTPNEVDVLLLQHPQEVHQAKGSAKLLQLSLAHCHVLVGEVIGVDELAAALARPTTSGHAPVSLLLYPDVAVPGVAAASHQDITDACTPSSLRLVVIDATWRKSLKMLLHNPALQTLPRLVLDDHGTSRYVIRKAPRPGQLSTLEATCIALARLEHASARYEPMLSAFDGFVAGQLAFIDKT